MPTINLQAQLSENDLLEAIKQLPPEALEAFTDKVLALRAQQYAPNLSQKESELFSIVNRSPSDRETLKYRELVQKRQEETLTEEEYLILIELSDRIETIHAERMNALLQLAQLRQTSLEALIADLGISVRMKSLESGKL
ncbi:MULTISPECIES: hypothetical protein [Spirulina sp. CCY15215]|uniref:hypothetical protein n=1 Tax=Spirulina sp. CCY15215 TaxID=2767591 RepID=UPI00194E6232|nr:hypothetical protein [Spirulina major]